MSDSKELKFMIHEEGKPAHNPRWQPCEVENATCPRCKRIMVVVVSPATDAPLYATCTHCGQYFLP